MTAVPLHPDTRIGAVSLVVADLARAMHFYRELLGFKTLDHHDASLTLTADSEAPLVVLSEQPGAKPAPRGTTGLYHFAILVPSRADLARSLRRLIDARYPMQGFADHLVSESIYLADPDGNGIEIYRDRPREAWEFSDGDIRMATDPLDLDDLLAELDREKRPWEGLPSASCVGHVHLTVADLREAEAFYHGVLGFDVMARWGRLAVFTSAGGYHHHVAFNVFGGTGAPLPPPDSAGMRSFSVVLPNPDELSRVMQRLSQAGTAMEQTSAGIWVRDPYQTGVLLTHRPTLFPNTARS